MKKYKDSDKFTLYLFGSADSKVYKAKVVTKKTLAKYDKENNKILKDVAGILEGNHKDVNAQEYSTKVLPQSMRLHDILD